MNQSVLISGGGIVGAFLGLELASRNIPFKIIEKNPPHSYSSDGIRSLTLNFTAHERLKELGIDASFSLVQKMSIYDGLGSGSLSFDAQEANLDYLASVLGFTELRELLFMRVLDSVIPNQQIGSFHAGRSGVRVTLSDGSELEASLLVIAEGRNSKLAEMVSSVNLKKTYQQIARTFIVEIPELESDRAIQIFYEKEIFALMPCNIKSSNNKFSVVWSVPEYLHTHKSSVDISAGLEKFEKKLSCNIKPISEILSFPLSAHHLQEYCDEGVCVIADAAHSIHPLAGQGINLGIADANILAEEIERGFKAGQDIGQLAFLKKYELRRKTINSTMINGVDLLFRVFQEENPYLRMLRNTGLKAVDNFSFLKKQFILHASGIHKI